jgi:pheromone shutdown protein TraB
MASDGVEARSRGITDRLPVLVLFGLAGVAVVVAWRLVLHVIFLLLGPEFEIWRWATFAGWALLMGGLAALGYLAGVRHSPAALVAAFTGAAVTSLVIMLAGW